MLLERHTHAARQRRAGRRRRLRGRSCRRRPALASLALDLIDDGTTTRDTFRIVDELDALGAQLSTAQLARSVVRAPAGAAENLAPSLDVLADVVLQPVVPGGHGGAREAAALAQIGQEKAEPRGGGAARRAARCCTARRTPTATRSPARATSDGRRMTRDDLVRWHRDLVPSEQQHVIVTGDVTMAQLVPALERAFGALDARRGADEAIGTVPAAPAARST